MIEYLRVQSHAFLLGEGLFERLRRIGSAVKDVPHQNEAGAAGRKRKEKTVNPKLVPQTLKSQCLHLL